MANPAALPSIRVKLPCEGAQEFLDRYAARIAANGVRVPTSNVRPVGTRIRLVFELRSGEEVSGDALVEAHADMGGKPGFTARYVRLDPRSIQFPLPGPPARTAGAARPAPPAPAARPAATRPPEVRPAPPPARAPSTAAPLPDLYPTVSRSPSASPRNPGSGAGAGAGSREPRTASLSDGVPRRAQDTRRAGSGQAERDIRPIMTPQARPPPRARLDESVFEDEPDPFAAGPLAGAPVADDPERPAGPAALERAVAAPAIADPGPAADGEARAPRLRAGVSRGVLLLGASALGLTALGGYAVHVARRSPVHAAPASSAEPASDRVTADVAAADVCVAEGRLSGADSAVAHLVDARRASPRDPRVLQRLALLADTFEKLGEHALARGDLDEARVHLLAAGEADPGRASVQAKLKGIPEAAAASPGGGHEPGRPAAP